MHARLSEICNSSKMNIKQWVMLEKLCLSVKQNGCFWEILASPKNLISDFYYVYKIQFVIHIAEYCWNTLISPFGMIGSQICFF